MEAIPIVFIVIGLPILSVTILKMTKLYYANKTKEREQLFQDETVLLDEIQLGMKDLKRRMENLESILLDLESRAK